MWTWRAIFFQFNFENNTVLKAKSGKNDIFYGKKTIELIADQKPDIVVCAQLPLDPLYDIIYYCKNNQIKTVFWMQDIYSVAISKILGEKIPLIGKLIGKYYFYKEKKCEYMSDKIIVI